jgi:short subunit fatty acids transporter
LLRAAFMYHQRLRAIRSLALYLAGYMLLLWFPLQLTKALSGHELPAPLEQMVPLARYPVKDTIFSAIQFVVVLSLVEGIWLTDWMIRNKIVSNGSEEECFSWLREWTNFRGHKNSRRLSEKCQKSNALKY